MQWKSNLCNSLPKASFVPISVLRTDELKSSSFLYVIDASAKTLVYYLMKVTSHFDKYSVSRKVWDQRQIILFVLLFYSVPEGCQPLISRFVCL